MKHLKVSRQRQDLAAKTALYVVKLDDLAAFEKLLGRLGRNNFQVG
jgi:hypothetical protein